MGETNGGNFFSSQVFAEAAVEAYRPRKRARLARVAVGSFTFDVPAADRELLTDLPFLDFFEPTAHGESAPAPARLARLPSVSLGSVDAGAWPDDPTQRGSPWVDWRRFSDWDDFTRQVNARSSRAFVRGGRKHRALENKLGPLRDEPSTQSLAVLDQCLAWKRAQYRACDLPDVLALPERRRLFHVLHERGALLLSALYAGETLVAAHIGIRYHGRLYSWVPAYDADHSQASPGLMLFEALMRDSLASGDRELDFLIGMEPYKLWYATDVRVVQALGKTPAVDRLWQSARAMAMDWVRPITPIYEGLRGLKRRAVERGFIARP